ncbi:MAG: flagellar hook capping protein [Lachnospiraceae bacterium]|nr:flagellar hook capping protein [Lachnospiraceae bacterium]
MSLAAAVVNGELVQSTKTSTTKASSVSEKTSEEASSMDKDSFLQLLVAQMKYQDPMEPTSNTEYISQYAQFSELEAMNNLSSNMDLQRATALVGKEVIVKSTGASGDTTYIQGKVDYVSQEGTKAYLYVDGNKYSIDDLDSVVDEEYDNAMNLAKNFASSVEKLPNLAYLTSEYKDVVQNLTDVYNDMSSYQKGYLDSASVSKYKQYAQRMQEILEAEEEQEEAVAAEEA